ncbi:RNA pseudouridylate synthase domain containing protein 2, partial [Nowakowskiella sp. JEL0078]
REIICEEPIEIASFKLGINKVSPDGKYCKTVFNRLSFNGITSVVECKPVTGRTHQIRVHLQYLGYPIANDPIYCSNFWGQEMGKGGIDADATAAVINKFQSFSYPTIKVSDIKQTNSSESGLFSTIDIKSKVEAEQNVTEDNLRKWPLWKSSTGEEFTCRECAVLRKDPLPEQLTLWLHAWRYEWEKEVYQTECPDWANEEFKGDGMLEKRFWKYGGKWDGLAP